jgi:hypothetical protein
MSVTTTTVIPPAVLVAMEKVPPAPQVAVLANQLEPAYTGASTTTLLLVAFLLAAVGLLLLLVDPRPETSKISRFRS